MSYYDAQVRWAIKQSQAKSKTERERDPNVDTTPSDVRCTRCKNFIWKSGGVYFRPKDGRSWMPFCRVDCAQLHVGKKATLIGYEEYCTQLMHKAIKDKK